MIDMDDIQLPMTYYYQQQFVTNDIQCLVTFINQLHNVANDSPPSTSYNRATSPNLNLGL
jgi:hypothetical protein